MSSRPNCKLPGGGDGHATIDGPACGLPGDKVQPVALALHELATNALKYGALSRPDGRLLTTWRLQGEGERRCLLLDWAETGVPMPDEGTPPRQGFGRQLIEQALPYQLNAETHLMFGTEGVRCRIAPPPGRAPGTTMRRGKGPAGKALHAA